MNTPTYEWSLGSLCEPIRSLVVELLATVGGACAPAANHVAAHCGLLYWIFQLFFIHKKQRGKVRKNTSIHKNLPWHESPDMFFYSCLDKLKEPRFVYLISCLCASTYGKQWLQPCRRKKCLYLCKSPVHQKNYSKDTDVNQFRDMHSYILVVSSLWHTKPTGLKVVREALHTQDQQNGEVLVAHWK